MTFHVGQTIRIDVQFRKAGVLVDPGAVVARVLRPRDGGEVTPAPVVVRDSVGNYHTTFVADVDGVWRWRIDSTDPAQGVAEGQLTVPYSPFE